MTMDFEIFDINSIILGVMAMCLFAECIILFVRVSSLKNKMRIESEKIRTDERLKYEKKSNELEMLLKEREIEMKSEYEDLLSMAKTAKREQDEKLSLLDSQMRNARFAKERAEAEYARYLAAKEENRKATELYRHKLSTIANIDTESIQKEAKAEVYRKCLEELELYKAETLDGKKREIDSQAKRILIDSMQRILPQVPQSATVSMVKIPDDAMKGKIIGKEGRNIRSFESETGTTLIIDETPDFVYLSSFNPVRREIAKIALEMLVADGRVSPTTIEATVEKARKEIENKITDIGSEAIARLGVGRVHPDIVATLGKLAFHFSLNQNTLEHSIETARIAGMIAAEVDCDSSIAIRAGLFHDIGKVLSEASLSHAQAGAEMLKKCGEQSEVVNAVEAHHSEVVAETIYAAIIQLADTLSATRMGARMEATEGYIRRMNMLEQIAMSFEGVSNAYVLQSGKELRVIVSPDSVSDISAREIAGKIKTKIEEVSDSSVPVKITLIREVRYSETTMSNYNA